MLLITYWVMTLCCCLYASWEGRRVGRIGAGLMAFKTIAGFQTALLDQSWARTLYPVLAVDAICLIAFLALALRSDRHWPLWTSGCALAAVTVHLASVFEVGIDPKIYHGLRSLWAIPMQLCMVCGIVLDARYQRLGPSYVERNLALRLISQLRWRH